MPIEQIVNFVSISRDLASGGQPSEEELRELALEGFEVIVNLGLLDPRYCLKDEAGLVCSLGMHYHHIPVHFGAPTREDLERFFAVMDTCRGKRLFVHCAANKRVSCFLALYGQARLDWSPEQAKRLVQRVWEPTPVWRTFIDACRKPGVIGRL